jgi:co-chaperonin GroES (HSP10)
MQITNDFYLVLVDQLFESSKTESGIITMNTAAINPETEDRTQHKRRYGVVMEVPFNFTNADVAMVDPGLPSPKRFVGHEWIEQMRQSGYSQGLRPYDERAYYPSTFERYDTITCRDVARKVDVKKGDKVYFGENATEEERFMGNYKGGLLFSVRVDEIQAVVRETKIFTGMKPQPRIYMQGGWVLVKLDMETWEEIVSPWGVIFKAAPEAKPLRGWVEEVAVRPDLKRGDHIIFERDADAPCMVEGKELVIMKDEDILAKIKPKK